MAPIPHPLRHIPDRTPKGLRLSPSEDAILAVLLAREYVTTDSLLDVLYGERSDGGPDCAVTVLRMMVLRLRRKLGSASMIENITGRGYRIPRVYKDEIDALRAAELVEAA